MARNWSGLLAVAALASLLSGIPAVSRAQEAAAPFAFEDADILASRGFLASHPDHYHRQLGIQAMADGRSSQARGYFRQAARYADKLSQGALAEMLWRGEGGAADRALGYAWMDLAAERGTPILVAQRERYWAELTAQERERAVKEGRTIFAEYADKFAKPRLERELRVALKRASGSRVGWVPRASVCVGEFFRGQCREPIPSARYYQARYWQPEAYWQWQDEILNNPALRGEVDIGPIKQVPTSGE